MLSVHFHNKIEKIHKISLNICFLELSEKFPRDSRMSEIAMVNQLSVLE